MLELTDAQKVECQKILDKLVDYWWDKLDIKMESVSFEIALKEIMEEITNG